MPINILLLISAAWSLFFGLVQPGSLLNRPTAQTQKPASMTNRRTLERNLLAPELYADDLKLQISLVDLPGSKEKDSSWDVSYQLYFIPEAEFFGFSQKMRNQAGGAYSGNPSPADFPEKLLLSEGSFKKTSLASLPDRWYERADIPFKVKIPAEQRTKFARLMLGCSVKIFDARLKTPLYRSVHFLTYPFIEDSKEKRGVLPRKEAQAHFYVTASGELFVSQLPRNQQDTHWP